MNGSPYSAFHLFIDEHILKCVQKHTINHGRIDDSDFNLHLDELESFIGLQLARGVGWKKYSNQTALEQRLGTTDFPKYHES